MILDRIESGVAVLCGGDGAAMSCPASMLDGNLKEDSPFEATVRDGKIISLVPAVNPSAGENRRRLLKMFGNGGENSNQSLKEGSKE